MGAALTDFWLLIGLTGVLAAVIAVAGAIPVAKLVPVRVRRASSRRPEG
jgi:hypothetical protein